MRELSLNVMDVAQNSISAGATRVEIAVLEDTAARTLDIRIADNGSGMDEEALARAADPFYTTRATRGVGLGLPLYKMACEMTGGSFSICPAPGKGTVVEARFDTGHIDMTPLGDLASTVLLLIACNPELDFLYTRYRDGRGYLLDTRELRSRLGEVPLSNPGVVEWLRDYLSEQDSLLVENDVFEDRFKSFVNCQISIEPRQNEGGLQMKSLEELNALREKAKEGMGIRNDKHGGTRVVVGMATCGIAAGGRAVLGAFVEEVARAKAEHVQVLQSGCIGMCRYEPVAEVFDPAGGKTTYVNLTPEKAARIVREHLVGGKVVSEYTVGASGKQA